MHADGLFVIEWEPIFLVLYPLVLRVPTRWRVFLFMTKQMTTDSGWRPPLKHKKNSGVNTGKSPILSMLHVTNLLVKCVCFEWAVGWLNRFTQSSVYNLLAAFFLPLLNSSFLSLLLLPSFSLLLFLLPLLLLLLLSGGRNHVCSRDVLNKDGSTLPWQPASRRHAAQIWATTTAAADWWGLI